MVCGHVWCVYVVGKVCVCGGGRMKLKMAATMVWQD